MKKIQLAIITYGLACFCVGFYMGHREGRKHEEKHIRAGVWVSVVQTTNGYYVAAITNENEVFMTNLNIQGWTK